MKKDFGQKTWFFPLPVLVISTYDEFENPDAMNAAWGGIVDYNQIELNLDPSHKTCDNIIKNKAFTVAFADVAHAAEADYLGIVSGHKEPNKIKNANLTVSKSKYVNAPVINEFPLSAECEVVKIEYVPDGLRVIGEIKNISADESILTDDKIDPLKLHALSFDPVNNQYLVVDKVAAKAFNVGMKFKK